MSHMVVGSPLYASDIYTHLPLVNPTPELLISVSYKSVQVYFLTFRIEYFLSLGSFVEGVDYSSVSKVLRYWHIGTCWTWYLLSQNEFLDRCDKRNVKVWYTRDLLNKSVYWFHTFSGIVFCFMKLSFYFT